MSRPRKGRAETFDKIEAKYEQWESAQPPPPPSERAYAVQHLTGGAMSKVVLTAIGMGIGFTLLVLAAVAFWNSAWWWGYDRDGAGTGYAIVGVFLVIAGLGATIGTWNHIFRVLDPNRAPSHAAH
ncbi:MAG: hypothetical protein ACR2H9_12210 [Longimicrobiaceae bacterium]